MRSATKKLAGIVTAITLLGYGVYRVRRPAPDEDPLTVPGE
jgi:hypothetical protein